MIWIIRCAHPSGRPLGVQRTMRFCPAFAGMTWNWHSSNCFCTAKAINRLTLHHLEQEFCQTIKLI